MFNKMSIKIGLCLTIISEIANDSASRYDDSADFHV